MLLPESQRVLKANAVRELGTRVAFNFTDLREQGDEYLAKIRQQAGEIVQSAQAEAAAIREKTAKEAKELGRREGLAEAARQIETQISQVTEKQVRERMDQALPAVAAVAEALRKEGDEWRARWENVAVGVAISIAEKILHTTLKQRPEVAVDMISEALRLSAGHAQVRVQLNPDDVQQLGDQATEIVKTLSACAEAVIVPDKSITRGGCRIETRYGEVDARLETILQRITEELLS